MGRNDRVPISFFHPLIDWINGGEASKFLQVYLCLLADQYVFPSLNPHVFVLIGVVKNQVLYNLLQI